MRQLYKIILIFSLSFVCIGLKAQFKKAAFTQSFNNDKNSKNDSIEKLFTFRQYFRAVAHIDTAKIGVIYAGSMLFVGGAQIYNRQYWKLPIIYGSMAGSIASGLYFNKRWHKYHIRRDKIYRNLSYGLLALSYWSSLMDGVYYYEHSSKRHLAGRATLYSLLLPGLGQAYNGEFWKIPIYYAGMMGAMSYILINNKNYVKFRKLYNDITIPNSTYKGPISASTAKFYRDSYRRLRDYSILTFAAFYVLQIIDANVFSYMQNFEVSNNLTMRIKPGLLYNTNPINETNFQNFGSIMANRGGMLSNLGIDGIGITLGFRF